MKTVHEVSELTGVTVRTLQYYDTIGLLPPAKRTDAGYRLYDDTAMARLQEILLFRELDFSLGEIKAILDDPAFDRQKALSQQIALLTLQRERIDRMIGLAKQMKQQEEYTMDFNAFDKRRIEEYKERAKAEWGGTAAYQEYAEKHGSRSEEEEQQTVNAFMGIFAEFGTLRDQPADSAAVQAQVQKLQAFITSHYYHCTDEILRGLGNMYAAEGEFRENIDKAGGAGTAAFVSEAIAVYCAE